MDYADPKGVTRDEKSEGANVTNSENGVVTLKKERWVVLGADQILPSSQNV